MAPVLQTALFCGVFLCVLREALLGEVRCAGGLCALERTGDFATSRTMCSEQGGQLFSGDIQMLSKLVLGLDGRFWVQVERGNGSGDLCACVSSSASVQVEWAPCPSQQAGFLCRYPAGSFCNPLTASLESQVSYFSYSGLKVIASDTFPPGSTAILRRPGSEHPETKHVCASAAWHGAPWSCEILHGGCDHQCVSNSCVCPVGHILLHNGFTCVPDPCAKCAQTCQKDADGARRCSCIKGFELAPDGQNCVDVDECKLGNECNREGEECTNTEGGFECTCMDGFELEEGACVKASICFECEHACKEIGGVDQCVCMSGFKVSPQDPTKCDQHCVERDCPARCDPNPTKEGSNQCYCPEGYVSDENNNVTTCTDINECESQAECEHLCENLFGTFRCLCREGFQLQGESRCVPTPTGEEEEGETGEQGSGAGESFTPASLQPAPLPSYIHTGSVLGITVFLVLCASLLFFLIRHAVKRCDRFELSSFKHPDVDIYYLQQVSTETYKRLSLDRQIRYEPRVM